MEEQALDEKFKGYIQVYTGNGKGKTTAALGLALRAAGHGLKTYFGQFLKGQGSRLRGAVRHPESFITHNHRAVRPKGFHSCNRKS